MEEKNKLKLALSMLEIISNISLTGNVNSILVTISEMKDLARRTCEKINSTEINKAKA